MVILKTWECLVHLINIGISANTQGVHFERSGHEKESTGYDPTPHAHA
jgi:hypothetical protein